MQLRAGKHQTDEALGRSDTVVTVQWVGLKVVGLGLALLTGGLIGMPVVTAVERLSLDLETIIQSATLPVERR
jgi:hypothetical protein